MTSKAGFEVTPTRAARTQGTPAGVGLACAWGSRCLPALQEEGQDDQHEGHQLRYERQTVEKFPYHDEDNVTRPALQFNACLAIGLLQATWNPSSVASRMREGGPG